MIVSKAQSCIGVVMSKIVLVLFLFFSSLNAYESEEKLKVVIIAKISKFVRWQSNDNEKFIITVLNNTYGELFNRTLNGIKIQNKNIEIKYIDNIDNLSQTNILYIPMGSGKDLNTILDKTKGKNILTISDIRGFADKDGVMQIYFISQKVKLRINLSRSKKNNLQISSSLLAIADVIKGI